MTVHCRLLQTTNVDHTVQFVLISKLKSSIVMFLLLVYYNLITTFLNGWLHVYDKNDCLQSHANKKVGHSVNVHQTYI